MASSSTTILSLSLINALITNAIIIDTNPGQIEGITADDGTSIFFNIPYALPPIGDLRWRAPKPYSTPYDGVYDGTAPGNACIQPSMMSAMMTNGSNGILSEDCLTLSIQTPYDFNTDNEALKPVFFLDSWRRINIRHRLQLREWLIAKE